jgi:hypothetical protein
VWGTIAVAVAAFALSPPLYSHDVYSYVDYARLGTLHGLDPYTHPPLVVPADAAFSHVTWTGTTSAYGPLFTLATYPLAWLGAGGAVWALKGVAAASVLGLAALVARLAPARGLDPSRAAAFVALNPLVLVHVVGGAHNDGLAMLVAMTGVAAVLARRDLSGGAALVAAAAIKASALVVAPFALLGGLQHPRRRPHHPLRCNALACCGNANALYRIAIGALAAALAIALAAYAAFGWHWLDAIGLAGENQGRTSHLSVPTTTARLIGIDEETPRAVAWAIYATFFAYLLTWTWRGGDWLRAAAWATLGLLLATSWLLPWYLVWPLPLVALSRDRALMFLTLALTAYQLGARIPI